MDVVGVGLQSGKIVLHNLKFDETVMRFQQDWGPVTALTFRTGIVLYLHKLLIKMNIILYHHHVNAVSRVTVCCAGYHKFKSQLDHQTGFWNNWLCSTLCLSSHNFFRWAVMLLFH